MLESEPPALEQVGPGLVLVLALGRGLGRPVLVLGPVLALVLVPGPGLVLALAPGLVLEPVSRRLVG